MNSIAHEISHHVFQFKRDGYLETVGPAGNASFVFLYTVALNNFLGTNSMHTLSVYISHLFLISFFSSVQNMVDQMTNMERIVNTPIPKSCKPIPLAMLTLTDDLFRQYTFKAMCHTVSLRSPFYLDQGTGMGDYPCRYCCRVHVYGH